MGIMAIRTTHFAFQDGMTVRQIELSTLVQVAPETGLRRFVWVNDGMMRSTSFIMNAPRTVTRLTAHFCRIGAFGLQSRMGRSFEILNDLLMTLLTTL
jgi:hypothetical protein